MMMVTPTMMMVAHLHVKRVLAITEQKAQVYQTLVSELPYVVMGSMYMNLSHVTMAMLMMVTDAQLPVPLKMVGLVQVEITLTLIHAPPLEGMATK